MAKSEVDEILYRLGYFDADANKRKQIQDCITACEEYMQSAGVPAEKLSSKMALTVKAIWADHMDRGDYNNIITKDGMIVTLISNLRRGK